MSVVDSCPVVIIVSDNVHSSALNVFVTRRQVLSSVEWSRFSIGEEIFHFFAVTLECFIV